MLIFFVILLFKKLCLMRNLKLKDYFLQYLGESYDGNIINLSINNDEI